MSGKKNDMKGAFQALKVNQPLRLPKEGPAFTPPPQSKSAVTEVPRVEAPPFSAAQNEHAHSEKARIEQPHSETPQCKAAPRLENGQDIGQRRQPQPEVPPNEAPRDELPTHEAPNYKCPQNQAPLTQLSHNEVGRNELPLFEATPAGQNEPARNEATPESSAAFFKLSPRVFGEPRLREVSGDCFRVFLWLSTRAWRYPDSTGVVRASVSVIEAETGMGHATVSRALKALKERELIVLIEVNFKRGNIWRIAPVACSGRSPDPGTGSPRKRRESPRNEAAHKGGDGPSERGNTRLDSSDQPPQIEEHLKKYKNFKKLSQEEAAPFLARIAPMSAPKKRESELQHLDALLECYSVEELTRALEYLESNGTLKGEKCHSPFTYLSFAADDVLKRSFRPAAAVVLPHETEDSDSVTEELRASAVFRFESELPSDTQRQLTENYRSREYPHGFYPPERVVRTLVALEWASNNCRLTNPAFLRAV